MHHRKNCDAISHLAFRLENFRFSCKAQYAIHVSPDVHSNARRFFFVALRSQGRNPKESVLLPFPFLLLPHPRGDRPPGNVLDGMSEIKFRSFPQNYRALYQNRRARIKRGGLATSRQIILCEVQKQMQDSLAFSPREHGRHIHN